jgi:TonB family protein
MNRLRVRVELNRRKTGVPIHELVSVVDETHKFFQLLAKDVQIDVDRGEWHASNFDPESLNFTAEFDGPASAQQIRAFGSAFGGATSLRRDTIAQFTRIADFIGEDELVGFGLYQSDQESEPSDWRCLSRLDAMRFADEIQLLAEATGDTERNAPLPAVMNGSVGGRRLFKDNRERDALATTDPGKRIREVESTLSQRIALLEGELETQARKMQVLENTPDADEKFLKMLGAMESFWAHAPQQLALSAGEPMVHGAAVYGESTPRSAGPRRSRFAWGLGLLVAGAAFALAAARSSEIETWLSKALGLRRGPQSALAASVPLALYRAPLPTPPDPPNFTAAASLPATRGPAESESAQSRSDSTPEMVNEIALDVPEELRSMVASEALVKVRVGIDQAGKVTTADVASTKGEGSHVLATEALKAARGYRFRPRHGKKTLPGQTVLTFTFNPDSTAWLKESRPADN